MPREYVDEEPFPMQVVDAYFITKAVAIAIGFILYLTGYFYYTRLGILSYFSYMFGNLTLYALSPLIPLVLFISFLVAFWGLRKDVGIIRLFAIIILVIDVFSFPVGTIISLIVIAYLAHPETAKYFTDVAKSKRGYRTVGVILLVISVAGFIFTSGMADVSGGLGLTPQDEEMQVATQDASHAPPEEKIEGGINYNTSEPINVIVQLRSTSSVMQAVDMQGIAVSDIQMMGGNVEDSTYMALNSITADINANRLVHVASNPDVIRIVENKDVVQLWDDAEQQSQNVNYRWETIRRVWKKNTTATGQGVTVAVVDSGIDEDIAPLQRNGESVVVDSFELYDDWTHWHGTAVASVIASQGTIDYPDIKGISPGVDLLDVQVFKPSGTASYQDILKGWEWVTSWKKTHPESYVICSNSIGVPAKMPGILDEAANNMAIRYGIPMVVASGNVYPDPICSPGMAEYALTVGAVDEDNNIASFSCRGPVKGYNIKKPDVVALGVNVPVFFPSDSIVPVKTVSGTSFSTPIVSSQMALLVEGSKEKDVLDLYDAIRNGADDLGKPGYDSTYGYGLSDVEGATIQLSIEKETQNYVYAFAFLPLIAIIVMFYPEIDKKLKYY